MNFICIVIGLILVSLLFIELANIVKSVQAKNWKITKGKLTKWNIRHEEHSDGEVDIKEFQYAYKINGIHYEATRIGFGFPAVAVSTTFAENTLDKALASSPELNVYYHPTIQEKSVLTVGIKPYHLIKVLSYILGLLSLGLVFTQIQ
jgi:hypothetical protein